MKKDYWITPAGAVFAIICFFLPWFKFSCGGTSNTISGFEIIHNTYKLGRGLNWDVHALVNPILITLISAVIIVLICYRRLMSEKTLWRSRRTILILSLIGLGALVFECNRNITALGKQTTGGFSLEDLGVTLQFGAFGVVIGFLATLFGLTRYSEPFSHSDVND